MATTPSRDGRRSPTQSRAAADSRSGDPAPSDGLAREEQPPTAEPARRAQAHAAVADHNGGEATRATASLPAPHWVPAAQVRPGDVVELTYSNGKLLEVESVERDTRIVQGVAEPVVVFHGWVRERDGSEWRVDDATWGVTNPLWWLDNLRDVIAYADPAPPAAQAAPDPRRVEAAPLGRPPNSPARGHEQPGPSAGEREVPGRHLLPRPVTEQRAPTQAAPMGAARDATPARRDAALAYAAAGVPVFPCYSVVHTELDGRAAIVCGCGDLDCGSPGKHPLTRHGLKEATSDPGRVAAWWEQYPGANVGIATGVAFDVLDLDGAQGVDAMRAFVAEHDLDLRRAPVVRTGSGGYHYLFAPSGAGNRAGLFGRGSHVDWRGIGGYVIAPPSQHVSGGQYRWVAGRVWTADMVLPAVPGPLGDKVRRREPSVAIDGPRFTPEHTHTAYGRAALESELAKVSTAPEGTRNHTLNVAGCKLFSLVAGGVLDEHDVRQGLTSAALQAGLQPREIEATLRSAHSYGSGRPRGIPGRPFHPAIPRPGEEPPGGEVTIPI